MTSAQLAKLIINAQGGVTVLTGAGISTPSGVPDFRSAEGLWSQVDPFKVATLTVFEKEPKTFWDFHKARFQGFDEIKPNRAHAVLAELESLGLIKGVVTQNIDGLHQAAGSKNLIEVHGSARKFACYSCSKSYQLEEIEPLEDAEGVPRCKDCQGVIKPGTVLFEEMLPEGALETAYDWCMDSELLICIGTSLRVYPVAGLPQVMIENQKRVAIVNREKTPYNSDASVVLSGEVDEELTAVLDAVKS